MSVSVVVVVVVPLVIDKVGVSAWHVVWLVGARWRLAPRPAERFTELTLNQKVRIIVRVGATRLLWHQPPGPAGLMIVTCGCLAAPAGAAPLVPCLTMGAVAAPALGFAAAPFVVMEGVMVRIAVGVAIPVELLSPARPRAAWGVRVRRRRLQTASVRARGARQRRRDLTIVTQVAVVTACRRVILG